MWIRWLIIAVVAVPIVVSASFAWRGYVSRLPSSRPKLGLAEGRLTPCPASPNCVCSQDDGDAKIEPLAFDGEPDAALASLREAVAATGGTIDADEPPYLRARYVTPFFGFVDDVEFLLDADEGVVHVRSASREGYSDLGANAKRVERIRQSFAD